jgi:hypothetical protein
MTSFAVRIEPGAEPRLAALALLAHLVAAAAPWLARCPAPAALALTLAALAGFAATLGRVPGPHCRLREIAGGPGGWQLRLAADGGFRPATLTRATRVHAAVVAAEWRVDGRRVGWVLPRGAVPAAEFRRLKALIRLSC